MYSLVKDAKRNRKRENIYFVIESKHKDMDFQPISIFVQLIKHIEQKYRGIHFFEVVEQNRFHIQYSCIHTFQYRKQMNSTYVFYAIK